MSTTDIHQCKPALEVDEICTYELAEGDDHEQCPNHRGKECSPVSTCDVCEDWTHTKWDLIARQALLNSVGNLQKEKAAMLLNEEIMKKDLLEARAETKRIREATDSTSAQGQPDPKMAKTVHINAEALEFFQSWKIAMDAVNKCSTSNPRAVEIATSSPPQYYEQIRKAVTEIFSANEVEAYDLSLTLEDDDARSIASSDSPATEDISLAKLNTKKINEGVVLVKELFKIPTPTISDVPHLATDLGKRPVRRSVFGNNIQLPWSLNLLVNAGSHQRIVAGGTWDTNPTNDSKPPRFADILHEYQATKRRYIIADILPAENEYSTKVPVTDRLIPLGVFPHSYEASVQEFVTDEAWKQDPLHRSRGVPVDLDWTATLRLEDSIYRTTKMLSYQEWFDSAAQILSRQLATSDEQDRARLFAKLNTVLEAANIVRADIVQNNLSARAAIMSTKRQRVFDSTRFEAKDIQAEAAQLAKTEFRSSYLFDGDMPSVLQTLNEKITKRAQLKALQVIAPKATFKVPATTSKSGKDQQKGQSGTKQADGGFKNKTNQKGRSKQRSHSSNNNNTTKKSQEKEQSS